MSPSTKPLPEEKLLEHLRSRDRASSAAPVAPVPIPGFTVPVHGSAGRVRRAQWSRAVRQLGFGFLIGIGTVLE